MSTMDDREHFGLGRAKGVDSLEVVWPDGRRQVLTGLDADRMVTVRQSDGMRGASRIPHPASRVFERVDPRRALQYKHQTRTSSDYNVQPLLPYEVSRQGPPLAVADVNGDGLDDVFIGGAAGGPRKRVLQPKGGSIGGYTQGETGGKGKEDED